VVGDPIEALGKYPANLVGIGAIMEGSGMNAPLWDLLFEMGWRNAKPDIDKWFDDYAERRYGKTSPDIRKAWRLLENTVYQGGGGHESDPRSLFCEKPTLHEESTFIAGYGVGPYDACKLRKAWELMLGEAENYRGIKTFEYDLVDVTREYISNANIVVYMKMVAAFEKKDREAFGRYSALFLEMILDEDRLLATDSHFLLGGWIGAARAWGRTDEEKNLFEWNARTLITTWGDRPAAAGLDDYASREWSGTLRAYYYMRWKTFIDDLGAQLGGAPPANTDWYAIEEPWNRDREQFASQPSGDPIAESRRIFDKYGAILAGACGKK
jgi:alpha-N-acetylglucosaminidase